MVLLLRLDILHHGIELTRTHRKGAISPLPEKTAIRGSSALIHFEDAFFICSTSCAWETVRGSVVTM